MGEAALPIRKRGARAPLAWFAGVRPDVLAECPSEARFYNGLGLAVVFTAALSGTTMSIALGYVLQESPRHLWPVGLVWSLVILNLDRLLVMTMTSRRLILAAIPRILIALIIGIQIAEPLVMRIFQPEIAAQMQSDTQAAYQLGQSKIANYYTPQINADNAQISALQAQENSLVAQYNNDRFISACESGEQACSLTHELGCGPVCQHYADLATSTQAQLAVIKAQDDPRITALQTQIGQLETAEAIQKKKSADSINGGTGLIAREKALAEVVRAHPGINSLVWFIRIAVILLDLLPLVLKAVHVWQGSAYEEVALSLKERDTLKAHGYRLGNRVKKARLEHQALADEEVDRVEIDIDRDRRVAEAEAAWTHADSYASVASTRSSGPNRIQGLGLGPFVQSMQGCERRSNSLAGGHGAGVIPYLHAAVIP